MNGWESKLIILCKKNINTGLAYAIIVVLFAAPALVYHSFGGIAPQIFWQGFPSGVGHPIIGVDHHASLIVCGLMVVLWKNTMMAFALFNAATTAKTFMLMTGSSLPTTELIISASIALTGFLVMRGRDLKLPAVVAVALSVGRVSRLLFRRCCDWVRYLFNSGVSSWLVSRSDRCCLWNKICCLPSLESNRHICAQKPRLSEFLAAGAGLEYLFEHVEGMFVRHFHG